MAKEVRIELTPAQKAKIREATGKTMSEIRVSSLGKNIAVSPGQTHGLRDESLKDDSLKDDSLKDDSLKDDSLRDDSLKDDSLKDDSLKDESLRDDSFKTI